MERLFGGIIVYHVNHQLNWFPLYLTGQRQRSLVPRPIDIISVESKQKRTVRFGQI